jgi:hypothetical protein
MRDLTFTELDMETAEQLPARELMGGGGGKPPCGCDHGGNSWTNGSYNGNTAQAGLINVSAFNGNGNGSAFLIGGGLVR